MAGIGIDILEIDRFKDAYEKSGEPFLERIFTAAELKGADGKNKNPMHLAGKFSAKEAVKKALPDGAVIGLKWTDIEILNYEDGKPYVCLHGRARDVADKHKIAKILVSITHSERNAAANAIAVSGV
ncbi:MAG: holo-ACP synthase [Candidatus Omnitrophica bacterium]|nr:holo-ACP synthase [Candidatus Omnitrophota bacterium]